jgi:RNA polymerase primary sigma factor
MLDKYLKDIRKFDPLTKKEELELFEKAKNGDKLAREKIINCNLRFVVQIAREYQNQGLALEELIQEGNLGLLKAFDKFDLSKGHKFITYAVWWIRQSITNAIHEHSRSIRLPLNKITNVTKISKLKDNLEQQEARQIGYTEISEYLEDPSIVEDLQFNYTIINLDKQQTENEKDLNDIIPDEDNDIFASLEPIKDELKLILNEFNEREIKILKMYFGIDHVRRYTLKEIGYELKLTKERIRQIKDKIIDKLQKRKRSEKLRGYIK